MYSVLTSQACVKRVILICNVEAHAIFNQLGNSERMMPEEIFYKQPSNAPITGECKQQEHQISC